MADDVESPTTSFLLGQEPVGKMGHKFVMLSKQCVCVCLCEYNVYEFTVHVVCGNL